jgi:predicted ATPase/DNA-binding CsgD family transcriptional regulator
MGRRVARRQDRAEPTQMKAHAWRDGRLPAQPGHLIGRAWELEAIRHSLLQADIRLLTLWGPAGIGKTRLALAVAADPQIRAAFKGDVVFVDLAPVRDPTNALRAIAEAFGLDDAPHPLLIKQLESPLSDGQVLLVLDNLEQVIEFAPQLVPLLISCPSLKVLATSRSALRLRWEHAFPIAPLAVPHTTLPTDAATAGAYAGVALFVERARAARPDFKLTDANAATVAHLCARLDGLPLAIELAAARTKGLPLLTLLKRLDDRFALLESGPPDLPARQRTLRRALMWSYDLLEQDQQALFARFSVFDGGCSPEAAEAVCADSASGADVFEGLSSLVRQSLLRLHEAAGGLPRYTMLATIRDFALEHLVRSGAADDVRRRHAEYYLALAEEAASQLGGPRQLEALDQLEREHANLREALRWAIDSSQVEIGLRLGVAMRQFWSIRGYIAEGRTWLRRLLALPQPARGDAARAVALAAAGSFAEAQADYQQAVRLQEESLALCRQTGDAQGIANALHRLGVLAKYADDVASAHIRLEESLAMLRSLGFTSRTPRVLQALGNLCLDEGDHATAREYFDQSLAIRRRFGDIRGVALALVGLARVSVAQGDLTRARSQLEEALAILRRLGDHRSLTRVLEVFAAIAARRGAASRALRLLGAAESMRVAVGARATPDWIADLEALKAAAHEELGEPAAAAAHGIGRSLALDEAVQLCLEDDTLARANSCPEKVLVNGVVEELTKREREIIELAVRGWSNRQIGNELAISERTSEGHIHNILTKLQLESRAQLVAWGARLGLLVGEIDLPGQRPNPRTSLDGRARRGRGYSDVA